MALGRLSADRELLALEACGISPLRLLGPVVAVGCIATFLGLGLSLAAVPATLGARDRLLIQSAVKQPGSVLRAGTVQRFGRRLLSAQETSSRGDDLRGVLLHAEDLEETLFAERASLRAPKVGVIELTLRDGLIVTNAGKHSQLVRFRVFRTELDASKAVSKDTDESAFASMPTRDLWQATSGENERSARSELARRFATPFGAVALTWLAVPLVLTLGRASRGSGGIAGLAVTVAYYGLTQATAGLLEFPDVPVTLAVWGPNAAAALTGGALLLRRFSIGREQKPRGTPAARSESARRAQAAGHRHALTRYIAFRYLRSSLLALGVLLLAYLLVDVLERLDSFAEHGATLAEVAHFYAARLPLLASRVVPMALLVGVALIVSGMAKEGELIGMEASGIRLMRGLASLMAIAMLATPVYFLLIDRVVPKTNALADELKEREIKDQAPDGWTELWSHTPRFAVHAGAYNSDAGMVRDLSLYELGPTGLPVTRIDARVARHLGHEQWSLIDATQTIVGARGLETTTAPATLRIPAIESSSSDPMHLGVAGLIRHIKESDEAGFDTRPFRVDLQNRLSTPFQCLLLPWIGLLIALTARKPAPSLLGALAVGVGFILVTGISVALGYGGWLSPIVAGWAPSGAFAFIGVLISRR